MSSPPPPGDALTHVALSPDGLRVAAVTDPGRPDARTRRTLKVWDVDRNADPVESPTLHIDAHPTLAFTADSSRPILAGDVREPGTHGATVTTFAADTGRELSRRAFGTPSRGTLYGVRSVLSPDETRVATSAGSDLGQGGSRVAVRDLATDKLLASFETATGNNHLAFSTDGAVVAVWPSVTATTGEVRDAATGRVLYTIQGHTRPVVAVTFGPDATRLLEVLPDDTVKAWELVGLREVFTADANAAWVEWVPGGRHVLTWRPIGDPAAARDSHLTLWDVASGRSLCTHRGAASGVRFSPGGRWVALRPPGTRSIAVIEPVTGAERLPLQGYEADDGVPGNVMAFSPAGRGW